MIKYSKSIGYVFLGVISIGLLVGLAWVNSIFIHQNPAEKSFLVPWQAMRSFLENKDDPYGETATRSTQTLFYGRPANPKEDPLRLDQPFASVILYFPLALISDYASARLIWMILLELALIGLPFLSISLFEWKLPAWLMSFYALSAVFGVQALFPLFKNDKTIFVAVCLFVCLLFLRAGRDELAGIFLALTIFFPLATAIFCLVVIWWVIKQARWKVIWGFLMTFGFLFVTSFILLPGWFLPFIRSIKAEYAFNSFKTTYGVFSSLLPAIGTKLAIALTVGVVILLTMEFRSRNSSDFRWLIWASMLALALNPLMGIPGSLVNNFFLFAPVTLTIKILSERIVFLKKWATIGILLGIIFVLSWGVVITISTFQSRVSQDLFFYLLPPFFTLLGSYWIRWWAVRPSHMLMEKVNGG